MLRLIYTSHSRAQLTPDQLEVILAVSRRNNARDEITGMLMYHDCSFLQLLEGPEPAVTACYERILKDRRHSGCIRIVREASPARIFSSWKMAYQSFDALAPRQQRQFIDIRRLAENVGQEGLVDHPMAMAVVMAFLSGFRTFDIAV